VSLKRSGGKSTLKSLGEGENVVTSPHQVEKKKRVEALSESREKRNRTVIRSEGGEGKVAGWHGDNEIKERGGKLRKYGVWCHMDHELLLGGERVLDRRRQQK